MPAIAVTFVSICACIRVHAGMRVVFSARGVRIYARARTRARLHGGTAARHAARGVRRVTGHTDRRRSSRRGRDWMDATGWLLQRPVVWYSRCARRHARHKRACRQGPKEATILTEGKLGCRRGKEGWVTLAACKARRWHRPPSSLLRAVTVAGQPHKHASQQVSRDNIDLSSRRRPGGVPEAQSGAGAVIIAEWSATYSLVPGNSSFNSRHAVFLPSLMRYIKLNGLQHSPGALSHNNYP